MKTNIIKSISVLLLGLLSPQITKAQGTTYLSNLGLASAGSEQIGNNSWYAAMFISGSNTSGYMLDSVQLAMTDASGNPNGFTVMVYAQSSNPSAALPGSSLGILDGSANPSTADIYTYANDSNITLSPNTSYFIVVTAGAAVADGAYEWSHAGTYSYNPNGGWATYANALHSNNGLSWISASSVDLQFAITATPIPEPAAAWLLGLGGIFFYLRRLRST